MGFIADGDRTDAVVSGLRDLEASAKTERAEIERLVADSHQPLRLPSIEEITRMVFDLEARATRDPEKTRAQLQRWHKSSTIRVRKRPDGVVEAIESTMPDWFALGTQFHPESDSASALDLRIFEEFLDGARAANVEMRLVA